MYIISTGVPRSLYDELIHQTTLCQNLCQSLPQNTTLTEAIISYIKLGHQDNSTNENVLPLVVHGEEGSGKSSLAALVTQELCKMDKWTKSVCIIRFVGASPECHSLDQVIASVSEHLCFLLQIHHSHAHKVRYIGI